jgi:hypothetical protein
MPLDFANSFYFLKIGITLKRYFMKKFLTLLSFLPFLGYGQICNPGGNVVIFSNYDGGVLNINVDANIPNLKIGVLSYEAVTVNLSGAFVNNVTAVEYAGYNGTSGSCGPTTTVINGEPVTATTNIVVSSCCNVEQSKWLFQHGLRLLV